jgi:hypothetical protein
LKNGDRTEQVDKGSSAIHNSFLLGEEYPARGNPPWAIRVYGRAEFMARKRSVPLIKEIRGNCSGQGDGDRLVGHARGNVDAALSATH